jgi:hypothetical protein
MGVICSAVVLGAGVATLDTIVVLGAVVEDRAAATVGLIGG